MLSDTFHEWGGVADDPDFSVDLTRSMATFHTPEILYILRRNCCTSQGDPDSSFPYLVGNRFGKSTNISMISNFVTHLRSYTNYAIADITGNSVPIQFGRRMHIWQIYLSVPYLQKKLYI